MKRLRDLSRSTMLRHTGAALLDQILNSGTGFVVGVWLIRHAPSADYGLFVLANAAVFLALGFVHAVVAIPMGVVTPKRPPSDQPDFIGSLAVGQFALWLPAVALLAAGAATAHGLGWLDPRTAGVTYVTLLLGLASAGREFFRQAFFIVGTPWLTLAIDGLFSLLWVVSVVGWTATAEYPAEATLLASAVASVLAAVGGASLLRWHLGGHLRARLVDLYSLVDAAKWGVPGMLMSWVQNQGFFYILGALRGASAVADVAAARLLLVPIAMLITAVESVLRPRAAAATARGELDAMSTRILHLTLLAASAATAYAIAVFLARNFIVTEVLHKSITNLTFLVIAWALVFLCQIWRMNIWVVLQAQERFRAVFHLTLWRGAASLVSGTIGIVAFDAPGIVLGLAFGELVYVLMGSRVRLADMRKEAT